MEISQVTDFIGLTNTQANKPEPATSANFNKDNLGERKILHKWVAQSRAVKESFNPKFLRTMMVIAAVIVLLLVIMQEFFLILVIASVIFVSYILSATPPENVEYELSNHGVKVGDTHYYWNELDRFFFTAEGGLNVLNIDLKQGLPKRLFLTVKDEDKEKVKEIVSKYLPFLENAPTSFIDKTYSSVVNRIDVSGK